MIEDIRMENMAALSASAGSVTALAKLLERSDSQVSQWINGSINSGTGKPRGMKPQTARWIESKTGKPRGWLDQDHSTQPAKNAAAETGATNTTLPPELQSVIAAYQEGGPAKQAALTKLAALPEPEMALLLLMLQSISAKYPDK